MLMVGVTLSLGSAVVVAAIGSFGEADSTASLGASLQESASGVQLGLVYAAVPSVGSCPVYQGANEGTSLTLALFDFGTVAFTPMEFVVNSTVYTGSYSIIIPSAMSQYVIILGTCAHASGLTIFVADAQGDEVQVGS